MNHPMSRRSFVQIALAATTAAAAGSVPAKPPSALRLGFMVWRIGDILDFDRQVEWVANAGFESISFNASAGVPKKWRGVDPAAADLKERQRIRRLLAPFADYEIHAPFDAVLRPETPEPILKRLEEVLTFAGDVRAAIVTVHVEPPRPHAPEATWQKALDRLDTAAAKAGVRIGLEFYTGFEWLRQPRRERIGATLDVGHMYLHDGAGYRPYGSVGRLARFLGDLLFHLHVHDYDGKVDHIEIGTGRVDFDELLKALATMAYRGALCLELNPERCSPEGIRRSAAFLRQHAQTHAALGTSGRAKDQIPISKVP
jgi:sugar phosphate isomerase/epimerase